MSHIKLSNTLTKSIDTFTPYDTNDVRIYSCGPTVYDYVHIGNLSAFIAADTLRRTMSATYRNVTHVMNFTDVDDKTIQRSRETYQKMNPMEALNTLTTDYGDKFLSDMELIGNDISAMSFIRATEDKTMSAMKTLITDLYDKGFAYKASDGIYFDINTHKKSGKKYGQLVELTESNTSAQRIQNDEYDKDSAHDFALWKSKKVGEPFWEFTIDGQDIPGRPGWHIECSAMSNVMLGKPFDIHTGGIDLAFPHHENEIAQSTAGSDDPTYANFFVHNEHVLVDNKKMSKSLGNFYTLQDLVSKGVDPLAFRLLVLQSHYRKPTNFSFSDVESTSNRLNHWKEISALRHQVHATIDDSVNSIPSQAASKLLLDAMQNNLDTPQALRIVDETLGIIGSSNPETINHTYLVSFLETVDTLLGVQLIASTPDIDDEHKKTILERQHARDNKDWELSDKLRDELIKHGIGLRDNSFGVIWYYL